MQLLVTRDHRVHDRDADAAADVAEQVVESAGVADLFIRRPATAVVESGTNTDPDPKPLTIIATTNDHCEIARSTCPNHNTEKPNMAKPMAISKRLSILLVRTPMTGMARIAPIPRGATATPAASAV